MTISNGIAGGGFEAAKPAGTNSIDGHYSDNTGSAFPASDVSAQGNAGLNQEGSYDMGIRPETNAYPESENM